MQCTCIAHFNPEPDMTVAASAILSSIPCLTGQLHLFCIFISHPSCYPTHEQSLGLSYHGDELSIVVAQPTAHVSVSHLNLQRMCQFLAANHSTYKQSRHSSASALIAAGEPPLHCSQTVSKVSFSTICIRLGLSRTNSRTPRSLVCRLMLTWKTVQD